MEENSVAVQLETVLTRFRENLDATVLPKLKEDFRIIHSAFRTVHSILLKKGFIHEDPYKSETRLSEIIIPETKSFSDSEKIDEMSIRLSSYEVQLDFLLNYYQFSTEFLDISRIRLIAGLLRYIAWDQLGPMAQDSVTKGLSEIIASAKVGADPLSVGLLNDSLERIQKTVPACIRPLKDLTDYSRELYKMEIRSKVFSSLDMGSASQAGRDDLQKQVKKVFVSAMPGKPFYPELIGEIIEEDYGPDEAKLKAVIIQRFTIQETRQRVVQQRVSFSQMILDALKPLCPAARYLEETLRKLVENNTVLQNRKMSLMEKFKNWIIRLSDKQKETCIYELEYFDLVSSSTKREKINFESFIADVQKRVRMLNGISIKGGPMYKRMEKAGEETLFSFLEKQISDLNLIYRRLQSLDTFFKNEVPREQRANIKGIKIELTAIKNSMAQAVQRKHEYIARKEEHEQMKKLGIE
ncbi:MAG: hypothetical protein LBK13_11570 [Spirochaetales bacterium]|jgi:hypothetical protein|nr:hypothetical protein [Spirochaetales bacterium]